MSNVATAATEPEQVSNLRVAAKLLADGSLTVTETIRYSFGSATPHTIVHRLPVSYRDGQGRVYRLTFALQSAAVDGASFSPEPEITSDIATIKLPVPVTAPAAGNATVYELKYKLSPIIMTGVEGDALKYPVTGLGWPVPVNEAVFELDAKGQDLGDSHCATGEPGVTTASCTIETAADTLKVQTEVPLKPGEGLSVIVSFERGTFQNYLQAEDGPGGLNWLIIGGVAVAAVLAALVGLVLARRRRGRYTGAKDEASPHSSHTP